MKFNPIFSALAVFGALAASQSAIATAINFSYLGSAEVGRGHGVGYVSGQIAPTEYTNQLRNVGIAGDSFKLTSNDANGFLGNKDTKFDAWCVDIHNWLDTSNKTYNFGYANDLATTLNTDGFGSSSDGLARVSALRQLANNVLHQVNSQTTDANAQKYSAAFQLAIWGVTFGTYVSTNVYSISSLATGSTAPCPSTFCASSTTLSTAAGGLATSWLAHNNTDIDPTDNTRYALRYLNDGTIDNTQDMVVFKALGVGENDIPEPATLTFLGLGLLGLGFARRKRG